MWHFGFWSLFPNWRAKWWPGRGRKCWKTCSVKRFIWIKMVAGTAAREMWLPVSVLPPPVSVPTGVLFSTPPRSPSLITKGGIDIDEGPCSFPAEALWESVLNFLYVKLLYTWGVFYKAKVVCDQKSKLAFKTTCWRLIKHLFFFYNFNTAQFCSLFCFSVLILGGEVYGWTHIGVVVL